MSHTFMISGYYCQMGDCGFQRPNAADAACRICGELICPEHGDNPEDGGVCPKVKCRAWAEQLRLEAEDSGDE